MSIGDPRAYVVNLSTVYSHVPLFERAAVARNDGYSRVESWWDFDTASPSEQELDEFAGSIENAGVQLVAINSYGGNRAAGERGLASLPDRWTEYRASIEGIVAMSRRLGVRKFNVAAGNCDERFTPDEQEAEAVENYRFACDAVGEVGGTVLIEALSAADNPAYPFTTGQDVVEFLDEARLKGRNIGLLFDTFHLASNGVDLVPAWRTLAARTAHLQLADVPGRGKPGTGDIDFGAFLPAVRETGYDGDISLEYFPRAD